jgi:hypothetical protein
MGTFTEEDPVPAEVVGDQAADGRPDERRQAEHRPKQPEVLAPLRRRVQVRNDGQRHREDRATAEPLEPAEEDELPHLLAEAGEDRAHQEQADREDEDRAPPEEVRELAVDRPADRRGQEIDGDRPRVERAAMKVGDDPRQCRADDRLVEGEQEHREQDCAEDLEALARREVDGRVLGRGRVAHLGVLHGGAGRSAGSTDADGIVADSC